jgi:4-amino-4-deoxy-L-arabinose transferase-like glycosyltransferase
LLWASRVVMVFLSIFMGVLIYIMLRSCSGKLSAFIWVFFFAVSPYFRLHLRRAMSEAPTLALLALAIIFCWLALNSGPHRQRQSLLWIALAGVAVGLSGAAKINGLVSCTSLLTVCMLMAFFNPNFSRSQRITFAIRSTALTVFVPLLVFILVNPFLYQNPIYWIVQMFYQRVAEIKIQFAQFPNSQINTLGERIRVIIQNLFKEYVPFHFPFSEWVYIPFCLLGFGFLSYYLWRWLKGYPENPAAVALMIMPLPLVLVMLMTPLNWDRYFLLPVFMVYVTVAIGLAKSILALMIILLKNGPAP